MSFPEAVDLVVYINLDIRTDRRKEIEAEFQRLEIPPSKILRWPATRNSKNGALGCTMSHIAVLEHLLTLPASTQNILILEDDFNFILDANLVKDSLTKFLQYPRDDWDLALLSYVIYEGEEYNSLVSISIRGCLASGYLVNRDSVGKLLDNFKEGLQFFMKTGDQQHHSVDSYWWKVMKDRRCFYFKEALGYQRKSYSNICATICERQSVVHATLP